MKNKLLVFIPYLLLVSSVIYAVSTGFNVKPTVHLWSWFGYEFGLDFSSARSPLIRFSIFAVAFLSWYWILKSVEREEKRAKIKEDEKSKMMEAA